MPIQSPTIAAESSSGMGEEEGEEEEENMFLVEGVFRKQKAFIDGPLSADQVSEQINKVLVNAFMVRATWSAKQRVYYYYYFYIQATPVSLRLDNQPALISSMEDGEEGNSENAEKITMKDNEV